MDTDEIEYEVANGGRITLPALNEEDKEFGMTAEIRTYIRQTIHHPNWIGWPTTEEFGKVGVLLQPLDDQTARALLVIDDEQPCDSWLRCCSPMSTSGTPCTSTMPPWCGHATSDLSRLRRHLLANQPAWRWPEWVDLVCSMYVRRMAT